MKPEEYRAMLSAIEMALKICEDSDQITDPRQQRIVVELRRTRDQLLKLVTKTSKIDSRDPAGWVG